MRVYYDCEFLEDGKTIELISIGMVREDNKELYRVNIEAPWERIGQNEWLTENVIPYLNANRNNLDIKDGIRSAVKDFLKEAHEADRGNLQLWGWYSAYDHVVLSQLFGKMIDLPRWCPMYTNDLKQEWDRIGNPAYKRQVDGLHNALEDAKFLRAKHLWLEDSKSKGEKQVSPNSVWKIRGFNSKAEMKAFEARTDFPGWSELYELDRLAK